MSEEITDVIYEPGLEEIALCQYQCHLTTCVSYEYQSITIEQPEDIPRFESVNLYIGDDTVYIMRYSYIRGWTAFHEKIMGGPDTKVCIRIKSAEKLQKIVMYYRQNIPVFPKITS
jgi:hypothetical protein